MPGPSSGFGEAAPPDGGVVSHGTLLRRALVESDYPNRSSMSVVPASPNEVTSSRPITRASEKSMSW